MDFSLSPNSTSFKVAFSLTLTLKGQKWILVFHQIPLPLKWHLVLHFMRSTAAGKAGVIMSASNSFTHLTLEERRVILTGIKNGSTKTAIAQTLGKDKSTIGKEIKLHRTLTHKCKMPLECNNYRKCVFGRPVPLLKTRPFSRSL